MDILDNRTMIMVQNNVVPFSGLKTEPCGKPTYKFATADMTSSRSTCCDRSEKYSCLKLLGTTGYSDIFL